MPKSNYMQIRMTDEMKERIRKMSDKKSLTMTSLLQVYISNGLQSDEAQLEFNSKENMNLLFKEISPDIIDKMSVKKWVKE